MSLIFCSKRAVWRNRRLPQLEYLTKQGQSTDRRVHQYVFIYGRIYDGRLYVLLEPVFLAFQGRGTGSVQCWLLCYSTYFKSLLEEKTILEKCLYDNLQIVKYFAIT